MSGSNSVHGIVVVGGRYALLNANTVTEQAIGFPAVLFGAGSAAGALCRHGGDVPDQRVPNQTLETPPNPDTRSHP
jgi:hypothetical protein